MNFQNLVIIKDTPLKGKGVYASENIPIGEIVVIGKPTEQINERTWQTLQMDIDIHVRMNEPFELVNHSCNPNCGIKPNQFEGYNLVSMKNIHKGEEITFDYSMTEWISIAVPNCRESMCRKEIKGGKFLSETLLDGG